MTYLIIGLLLITVGGVVILAISEDRMAIAFIGIILLIAGIECLVHSHPQAIDVYRGRTTLEITYKDSIPVDSVVVFKE